MSDNSTDNLSSDKEVDYTQLRDLLADARWKEADEETLAVMLKACGRGGKKGGLTEQDIKSFSPIDLHTIDTLWTKYSKGNFGFSVQKGIWLNMGGQLNVGDYQILDKFCTHVGWRGKGFWSVNYDDLTFNIHAPNGHLPALWSGEFIVGEAVFTRIEWYLFWRRDL